MKPRRQQTPTRAATLRRWRIGSLVTAGACLAAFTVNAVIAEIDPGNAWGLVYGTAATVVMVAVALYGARRRTMPHDFGRSRTWLLLHVYGGGLFLLLVLMHSGFGWPRGGLNILLWCLSVWVAVSGTLGVLLQRWIPRLLNSGLSVEAVYERIPDLVTELRQEAEALAAEAAEPVQLLYEQAMAPAMAGVAPRPIYYFDITGGIGAKIRQWEYVGGILPSDERQKFDRLTALYRAKSELDAQCTLQRTLRWWLYTHIPASVVLLGAVAIHLYAVLFY